MSSKEAFERYLLALRKTSLDDKTEHTDRGALQDLLQAFAPKGVNVQHEPKRIADKGAPDFKVTSSGLILGYVENKGIGENLTKVLKSDQIKKYQSLSDNIILTDYLDFIWINKSGPPQRERLCSTTDLESRKFRLRDDRIEAVTKLLSGFFSTAPEGIGTSQKLALALATRSKLLRDFLGEELVRQEREDKKEKLFGLFQVFREQIFHELTLKEFADAFAQMLAYGLFLARLNSDSEPITLHNAREYVPGSFRLIRELVDFLTELEKKEYREVRWVVEEVLSIVNNLKLDAIHENLSFRNRKAISRKVHAEDEEEHRLFERDPFIYFYEYYLKHYDKEMRESRGVYYTPPPIVNFIVRAIDDILKENFGIHDGLANNESVTVLDFACGTGTFLLEVFQRIFDNIGGPDAGKADAIVREHILKNLFGFEYLIAPYTIAHLKLSQYLKDQKHPLKKNERLQVFLTNTLEPVEPQKNLLLPAVSAEVEAAQKVKDRDILVITGNPPYSGHSKNKGKWIKAAIEAYKRVDGKPLGEKNPKWLQDDYVKFIRFAQLKMEGMKEGIVGIITNHSYLDNPTFRGMRQSLASTFDQIFILDLHGSTKPKEMPPSGVENQNVFDIQKGVAITLFVKKSDVPRGIWYSEFWGTRLAKYKAAANSEFRNIDWRPVRFFSPYYMFEPLNWAGWESYGEWWQVADGLNVEKDRKQIFKTYGVGAATGNDHVAIQFDKTILNKALEYIRSDNETGFKAAFGLKKLSTDWSWKNIRADVGASEGEIRPILYRPFDERFTYYTGRSNGFHSRPRPEIANNFRFSNLALITSRLTKGENYAHVNVTDKMSEAIYLSSESSNNGFIFPLLTAVGDAKQENFTSEFRVFLDAHFEHHYTPEEVLGYIYAVLHAPIYRSRYAEFLRIDFPRIPFPKSYEDFETLSQLGWALVEAHLLRQVPRQNLADFHGKGDRTVEFVRHSPEEKSVAINKTQFFKPVPEEVWNFHIGGYQVLDKYLKSRKERVLSLDEINHVAAVADSLAFTIGQMAKIDLAYKKAFAERG